RSINVFCRHVELHQKACHRAFERSRQRYAAADPVEYLRVGIVQQAFKGVELRRVECFEITIGKASHDQIRFLRAPVPALESEALAPDLVRMLHWVLPACR